MGGESLKPYLARCWQEKGLKAEAFFETVLGKSGPFEAVIRAQT
jgi:hypothetical protein